MQKKQAKSASAAALHAATAPATKAPEESRRYNRVLNSMAKALSVTYRRERSIFENAADVICSFDRLGRITEINPACRDSWGYEPSELIGKFFLHLVNPVQRIDTAKTLANGAASNEKFWFETEILRKDRSCVVVRWSAFWSELDSSFFCVAHDITQQRHLDQLKAEFLGMISHDLRTPLCSISSFLDLLASGVYSDVPANVSEAAKMGQRSVKRLIKLTEDLLDLERLESGCWPMDMGTADVADIILEAIGNVKQFASDASISIDSTSVSSREIEADPGRITQVIVNLLSNAVKFSPKNAAVKVGTTLSDDYVEVWVQDSGRGIPEHMQAAIFDRFKQVEIKDSRRGSGLGLAIAKSIVEQHDGKIGFDSKPGAGSRFWFRLPTHSQRRKSDATPVEELEPLLVPTSSGNAGNQVLTGLPQV